jgi:hypothetical protein
MSLLDLTLSLHTIDGYEAMHLIQARRRTLFLGNKTDELKDLSQLEDRIIGELTTKNRHYVKDNVELLYNVINITKPTTRPKKLKEEKKKQSRVRVLSPEKIDKVKESIKKLLKEKFRFTNIEECASTKRSQNYYTSKSEIFNVIEEVPDIKKLMPSKYKSMNKDDLCKSIFGIKN